MLSSHASFILVTIQNNIWDFESLSHVKLFLCFNCNMCRTEQFLGTDKDNGPWCYNSNGML